MLASAVRGCTPGRKVRSLSPGGSEEMSDRGSTIGSMGEIVELAEWREARERDPVVRLERAVARLEQQFQRGPSRIGRRVESELLAITGAVSAGLQEEAAERAERLAERLEHPSARLSG